MDACGYLRTNAARRVSRAMIGLAFVLYHVSIHAHIAWDGAWAFSMNGQRFSVETFTSPQKTDSVLRELARLNPVYQRFVISDGRVLVSGADAAAHWLAEIQPRVQGSQGYVSALYFDPDSDPKQKIAANFGLSVWGSNDPTISTALSALQTAHVVEFDSSATIAMLHGPLQAADAEAGLQRVEGAAVLPGGHPSRAVAIIMPEP